jgi:hypothetical protein
MPRISFTGPLVHALAKRVVIATLAVPALLSGSAFAASITPPSVPARIQVPAGNVPFLVGHATGTQNYTCQVTANGYAWTLVGPVATLVDDKGKQIMTHYTGPTWQANDGTKVVATRVDGVSVSPTAIPWLLLRATPTTQEGDGGRLTDTTYIQRVSTTGGLAPMGGCDQAALGAARNVPYTADYYFYKAIGSN